MSRDLCRYRRLVWIVALAALPWTISSDALAAPVQFVPITSRVMGPPYPTGAVTTDLVVDEAGTPRTIDRLSSSVGRLSPVGAVDWFIADSFSFGVEREMKESGEKGGTEDINIGVGELQECTISKSMDAGSTRLAQFAINGNSLSLTFESFTSEGTVKYKSDFATAQPAVFTGVSVVPSSDGRSFDLNFSLLYSADYNPQLPIISEVMTGDFFAVPEPITALMLVCILGFACYPSRARRPAKYRKV
jgi:hypothetical protein